VKQNIFKPRIRSWFSSLRKISGRLIYPIAPKLHEFIFIRLTQYFKRRYWYIRSSIFSQENLYYAPKSIPPDFRPKVSIIVICPNSGSHLRQRLDSIYTQTYPNIEVILLDDASSDGNQEILEEYRHRYAAITQCIYNKENSSNVFNQWQQGFEIAQGDLVWISESDAYCSENLLTELVKYFANSAVMLAYCRSVLVGREPTDPTWSLEEYLKDLNADFLHRPFVMSAHYLVNNAWGIKNILPNVSSAVFRHPGKLELLDNEIWKQMRVCGEWVFYLHLMRGGLVAYTPTATSYYRSQESNTSRNTYSSDIYYQEYEVVAKALVTLYRLSEDLLERQKSGLQSQWKSFRSDYSEYSFENCYSYKRIQHFTAERKPNLLMVSFALTAGGGETFPIKLANMLKGAGYALTFLNCHKAPTETGIRTMLRKDIPLLELDILEKLSAVVKDMGIELVHSHHGWVDEKVCRLLEHNPHSSLVITTHGMYETMRPYELACVLPLLKKRVGRFVYLADKNLSPFRSNHFDMNRFVQIDNAVEITPISPVPRSELGIPENAFLICLVSRAIPEKGWQEAIEAVKLARKISEKDVHLILVGTGPEYNRLKSLIHDEYIHFLGFRANVRDYFATSDLGFLPSRFLGESFPLVLIECLHSNRPMLATNIGEIKKMLSSDRGPAGTVFNLENGNVPIAKVAEIIARYAEKTKPYLDHLLSVPLAASKFDPSKMLGSYEKVYLELLKEGSGQLQEYEDQSRSSVMITSE
jgi:glycosyltransferase involved in cell wall biosynthesis